jgi:hypothetical protein
MRAVPLVHLTLLILITEKHHVWCRVHIIKLLICNPLRLSDT